MLGIHFRFTTQRHKVESLPTSSASKQADSNPARLSIKKELPPLNSADLRRIKSRTDTLPSQISARTDFKPVRHSIKQATADTVPPKDFAAPPAPAKPRKFLGITLPFQKFWQGKKEEQRIRDGATEKIRTLRLNAVNSYDTKHEFGRKPEYMEIIRERNENYDKYSTTVKARVEEMLHSHPEYRAELAKIRNGKLSVPNGPTATRPMTKGEQTFLTNAFQKLNKEIAKNPFHMHGETAITGNKKGEITQFNYTPGNHSHADPGAGDKFHLHTHPPFMEPFTSSASEQDHIVAAHLFKDKNLTGTYVTNGKDVLHIQPHSLELVKLIPDPMREKKLGAFPVAYELPTPQQPRYPFSNHEAPGAL